MAFRTLHVTDYASAYEGAFVRQLRMLDDELRARGADPSELCLTAVANARPWADTLRQDGWRLHTIPAGRTHAQRSVARALVAVIRDRRPDVVHVHFGTYDLSARRAVRAIRRELRRDGGIAPRLVWHYRTALVTAVGERSLLRRLKDRWKFGHAARDADLVVGVTHALAREAVARGAAAARARGIVAGCDTDRFRPDADTRARIRAELGLADDDVFVLHMGWSWHRKGGDLLADAMRMLDRRPDGARIVAYSIGAPQDELLGPVRPIAVTDRVHELHQASDLFVSSSRSEGFGNGLVEAMACERVAVAAAADGQIETFAGVPGVRVIPVDVPDALAHAIASLVDERAEWARLGAANRRHVLEHHSMRRWAREMADAYAELVPGAMAAGDDARRAEEVA